MPSPAPSKPATPVAGAAHVGGGGGGASAKLVPPAVSASAAGAKPPPAVLDAAVAAAASSADAAASTSLHQIASAAVVHAAAATPARKPSGVYYHRELLCRSLDGRRIDLITLSGMNGIKSEREPPLDVEGLMPEGGPRPRAFANKPVFLLTSRVHPGETPASHVFDGFLQMLLRDDDPRARALRERFVFKLVPMINPDGVFRGHYRADTLGQNLNRCYLHATLGEHPSVYGIAALVRQLHRRGDLQFYIDLHAHATKRGCFLYGNAIHNDFEKMVDNVLYAKLVAANTKWFDFNGCVFTERNMYGRDRRDGLSKAGSGRVSVYKMTDLTFVYTLECNYNMGKVVNRVQPPHIPKGVDKSRVSPPAPPTRAVNPKYTPEAWRSVGKALALAALDIVGANPCSRLGAPGAGGYARLRGTVSAWVKTYQKKEARRAAARRERGDDDDEEEEDEDGEGEEEEEEVVVDEEERGGGGVRARVGALLLGGGYPAPEGAPPPTATSAGTALPEPPLPARDEYAGRLSGALGGGGLVRHAGGHRLVDLHRHGGHVEQEVMGEE